MKNLNGFIMLHRKIIDWEWYEDANVRSVFIHLLLLASFKPTRWQGIELLPGQVVTSNAHLAEKLGISVMQVRNALKKLQASGEIYVKTTNKFTLVTLANWALYQIGEEKTTNKEQTNNNQTTNKQQHRNNVNNVNNVNKYKAAPKLQVFNADKYDYEAIRKRAREKIREKIAR